MSFNLGNNDRNPGFGGKPPGAGRNPLSETVHSSEKNKGGDMVLTKDHPGWSESSASSAHAQPSQQGDGAQEMPQRPPAAVRSGAASAGGYDRRPDSELPSGGVPRGARFDPILPGEVRPSGVQPGHQLSGEPDYDDMAPPGCP